ncbi:uridine diphosphate-N-acetylglucosamine-binding protein YvcK [Candidatus Pacearchaeota archaeon]|nr:uridine diphosphate-N-acetylglucosamine-binding protein YvcK [Candidatus Pacearchaeota archaeon]
MKKVVTIGGGTGHHTLLRGLKDYDIELTAIVSIVDNGGSSGRLREELVKIGVLSPGDLRNCFLALTDEAELPEIVRLFNYRFDTEGELSGHNLGNILLSVAQHEFGKTEGIKIISQMLKIKGRVLPVSVDSTHVHAETYSGKKLSGQVEVSYPEKKEKIKNIWLEPEAFIYKEAAKAIREADLIVICPGDLYGSIIPSFLVRGFEEALRESKAKLVYVCNLVTKQGTHEFKASDFVNEIEKYAEKKLDYVILNSKKPDIMIVDKYKQEESYFVIPDIEDSRAIKKELLEESEIGNKTIARHNSSETARLIMSLL